MNRVNETMVKIERSLKSIMADLDALEESRKHFHRKDERRRFEDLKLSVKQLQRQVQILAQECEP